MDQFKSYTYSNRCPLGSCGLLIQPNCIAENKSGKIWREKSMCNFDPHPTPRPRHNNFYWWAHCTPGPWWPLSSSELSLYASRLWPPLEPRVVSNSWRSTSSASLIMLGTSGLAGRRSSSSWTQKIGDNVMAGDNLLYTHRFLVTGWAG